VYDCILGNGNVVYDCILGNGNVVYDSILGNGKRVKYSENNPSQCHFVYRKSHVDWSGKASGPLRWEADDEQPGRWHVFTLATYVLTQFSDSNFLWTQHWCIPQAGVPMGNFMSHYYWSGKCLFANWKTGVPFLAGSVGQSFCLPLFHIGYRPH